MKSFFATIFTALVLLGTLKEASIYIVFKLNQKYIAENLCVEKDIEDSTCNGCCQLKQKLIETKKNEQENIPERQRETLTPLHFIADKMNNNLTNRHKIKKITSEYSIYSNKYSYIFISDCFHPPKF